MQRGFSSTRELMWTCNGADVNGAPDVEPVFPTTPLANAIAFGHDEIADILREAGAKE